MHADFSGKPQIDERLSIEHVAARCQVLARTEDKELIYALQARAIADKGLREFTKRLVQSFPERLGPEVLREIKAPASGYYSGDEVRIIRKHFPGGEETYLLKGELSTWDSILDSPADQPIYPSKYLRSAFVAEYKNQLENLDRQLEALCFSDDVSPATWTPWYFPRLIESCRELLHRDAVEAMEGMAETVVTRSVFRAVEVARQTSKMTLVHGVTRLGKSYAAKTFQSANPGRCRYMEVPVYSEDKEFFREMAKAMGFVGIDRLTAADMRMKIEEVARMGDLTIIMDESQYLLGTSVYPRTIPRRIAWICSLVNKGVSIVLISVPKFLKTLENLGKNTPWEIDQMFGRISETFPLPIELNRPDLLSIVRKWLRTRDEKAIEKVADVAMGTPEFLGAVESTARRAMEVAISHGRSEVIAADVDEATFQGNAASIRSEEELQAVCNAPVRTGKRTRTTAPARGERDDFTHPRLSGSDSLRSTQSVGV